MNEVSNASSLFAAAVAAVVVVVEVASLPEVGLRSRTRCAHPSLGLARGALSGEHKKVTDIDV